MPGSLLPFWLSLCFCTTPFVGDCVQDDSSFSSSHITLILFGFALVSSMRRIESTCIDTLLTEDDMICASQSLLICTLVTSIVR